MAKYVLAFALSYLAALLVFAVMGTVSLFRWPVGPVPIGFALCWTLFPLLALFVGGAIFARRWGAAVGAQSLTATLIPLAALVVLTALAWRVGALQAFTAPGRLTSTTLARLLSGQETEWPPLTLLCAALYPAFFYLGWRVGA